MSIAHRPAGPPRAALDRRPWPGTLAGVSGPLVGRSDDLIRLTNVLGGRSAERTALVVGDAGIGKSRLLAEAAQQFAGAGGTVLQEEINALARRARIELAPASRQPVPSDDLPYSPTGRELDVSRLLARGRSNAQIGSALFMSPKTASAHVTHILRKLGVAGRVQAATLAERAGTLDEVEDTSD